MADKTKQEWLAERMTILEDSTNPEELTAAAVELALSDDPEALETLGSFLGREDFLARLDDLDNLAEKTRHLSMVLTPLIQKPSPETASLCLSLLGSPAFLADPDRKSFLLEALAAVTPMNAQTVKVFRNANDEGYFGFNALLLTTNASPLALDLFADMMTDESVPAEDRVECLHRAIVPNRARLPILEMVNGLLEEDLEDAVAEAAIESVFDYQPQWVKGHPPPPPAWRTASSEVLRYLVELGNKAKRRPNLSGSLSEAIDATLETARALLSKRAY